ncbi:hypothetical protein [Kutzneria sp. NPDC052558]|uniref:hypothetical protein n=1 Tax=Kutzneria sp. NPDC052558 TaxID=3364121 RepID=UPI0037C88D6C
MAYNPPAKNAGDTILSADWNAANTELKRLETAKLDHAGGVVTGDLTVNGTLNASKVTAGSIPITGLVGTKYVVPFTLPPSSSTSGTGTFDSAFEPADSATGICLLYFPVITSSNATLSFALTYVNRLDSASNKQVVGPRLTYTNLSSALPVSGTLYIYAVKGGPWA